MSSTFPITLIINFNDPDLDRDERAESVNRLLKQLVDIDDVEAERVVDPNPPQGNKAGGGFLLGLLKAQVNVENLKKVAGVLNTRLTGQTIEIEAESNGKKFKVKVGNQGDLNAAMKAITELANL